MARRIKQGKKCSVCNKGIREWNKSGLCSHHYRLVLHQKIRKKRRENNLCIDCRTKIEPIILYPDGDVVPAIIKTPIRCPICRSKQQEYERRFKEKHNLVRIKAPIKNNSKRTANLRTRRRKAGLCIDCNVKIKPIITYPAGDTLPAIQVIPSKCYPCRLRQGGYNKTAREKIKLKKEAIIKNTESVTTL